MSDFWLGVWLGLAVWKLGMTFLAAILVGRKVEYGVTQVVEQVVFLAAFLTAAVLTYIRIL